MKLKKSISRLGLLGLIAGASLAPGYAQTFFPANPNTSGVTARPLGPNGFIENFDAYQGSTATFSGTFTPGFYVEYAGTAVWRGLGDGSSNSEGWWSYGSASLPGDRAFGIHEFGGSGFGDTRLYLKFTNTTGASLPRVLYSYATELWNDGNARLNSITLKYNTSGTSGFSDQPDIVTAAAVENGNPFGQKDGNVKSVTVTGLYVFNVNGVNTPLGNNSTGYFRWQYGTVTGGGASNTTRDGLGIDDIEIKPLPSGTNTNWAGSGTNWTGANWASGFAWTSTVTGRDAVFAGANPKNVNVDANVKVVDLEFTADGYNITNTANSIELGAVVDVSASVTGTLATNLSGTLGLNKLGAGTLVLGGSNTVTGGLSVYAGTLRLGADNPVDASNRLRSSGTTDLNGFALKVNGIAGSGQIQLPTTSALTIAHQSNTEFRGAITGTSSSASVIVDAGPTKVDFTQRLAATTKTFQASTLIKNGVLEVTDKGQLANTSKVTVEGPTIPADTDTPVETDPKGVLSLSSDLAGAPAEYTFGSVGTPIDLKGGNLSADKTANTTQPIVLKNGVQLFPGTLGGFDNRIYAAGGSTTFRLDGAISGTGNWRKQGAGVVVLNNPSNSWVGELNVNNGTVEVSGTGSYPANSFLFFGDGDQLGRKFVIKKNVTVGGLESNVTGTLSGTNTPANYALIDAGAFNLTINQAAAYDPEAPTDELKNSHQGDITGTGSLIKEGNGTTRLTRWPKNFSGTTVINDGVLQVSVEGQYAGAGGPINVNTTGSTSGQLRLSSGGTAAPVAYTFGSGRTINLASTGRTLSGIVTSGTGFGVLGGLRFDPDSSLGEKFATLANNIAVTGVSDIHVNGLQSELTLTGTLSGSADVEQTGGGVVVIAGANVTPYDGTYTIVNGTTRLPNQKQFGGTIVTSGTGNPTLEVSGTATVAQNVTLTDSGTTTLKLTNGAGSRLNVTGEALINANTIIDLNGVTVATGTHTILSAADGIGSYVAPTLINNPSGASVQRSGGNVQLVK